MFNKFGYKFWLYYSTALSTLIVVGGFFITNSSKNLIIANLLFIPVVLMFWLIVKKFLDDSKLNNPTIKLNRSHSALLSSKFGFILLLYSLLFSTLISVGGFAITRSTPELISNIVFLPLTLFCWYLFKTRPKTDKGVVTKATNAFLKTMAETAKKRGLDNDQN